MLGGKKYSTQCCLIGAWRRTSAAFGPREADLGLGKVILEVPDRDDNPVQEIVDFIEVIASQGGRESRLLDV